MLDPLAIAVCCAFGAWVNRAWISAAAGFASYIPLALMGMIASGIPVSISYVLLKSTAGIFLGLIGLVIGRLVRKRKTGA
ncbi:hypothetical protein [Pseudomonas fluorescens]|uniref:hypothetical protein n=1 Tax=Pseudomonas fluorescens TaxID=294 RepID=UPI0012B7C89A|nr:hypothetical protein [Pseudomonas fluorescens]